jgi:hypothetical protein
MSEKPISPLRRRMIEDMTVRNFVEKSGRWCPVMGWRLDEFAIQISMLRLARHGRRKRALRARCSAMTITPKTRLSRRSCAAVAHCTALWTCGWG